MYNFSKIVSKVFHIENNCFISILVSSPLLGLVANSIVGLLRYSKFPSWGTNLNQIINSGQKLKFFAQ